MLDAFQRNNDVSESNTTFPKAIFLNVESLLEEMQVPEERMSEIELPKNEYIEYALLYISNKEFVISGIEAICDEVYHVHQREFGEVEATAAKDAIEILCKGLHVKLEEIGAYQESGVMPYTEIGMFDGKHVLLVLQNND